jgi:hypothetical protein
VIRAQGAVRSNPKVALQPVNQLEVALGAEKSHCQARRVVEHTIVA